MTGIYIKNDIKKINQIEKQGLLSKGLSAFKFFIITLLSVVILTAAINADCYAVSGAENVSNVGQSVASLLPFALIMLVVYFMMIRPQHKKMREHQNMLKALKKDDRVIVAGIGGIISKIGDDGDFIDVEIAKDVVIKVKRDAVHEVLLGEKFNIR